MNDLIDLLQWPAMAVTVAASWLVASASKTKRRYGFWNFLLSNVLWVAWGINSGAYALICLQFCLAFMNVRGVLKAEQPTTPKLASSATTHAGARAE